MYFTHLTSKQTTETNPVFLSRHFKVQKPNPLYTLHHLLKKSDKNQILIFYENRR